MPYQRGFLHQIVVHVRPSRVSRTRYPAAVPIMASNTLNETGH